MKKIILTSIILIVVLTQGYGQKQCDIKSNYEDFISVERGEYEGRAYLTTQVVETQKKSCFSDLINNNPFLISYLLQFASVKNHKNILEITDSIDFKSKVSFGKDYIEITESNGKFIETQCHKKQYYIIDSIINNKEIWVTTWDHYMNECSKIYFYLDYPYLYKSTLKNKIGIIKCNY